MQIRESFFQIRHELVERSFVLLSALARISLCSHRTIDAICTALSAGIARDTVVLASLRVNPKRIHKTLQALGPIIQAAHMTYLTRLLRFGI